MQILGTALQLLGIIITGLGLLHAWNTASGRFNEWRNTLRGRLTELRAFVASRDRGMTRQASAGLTVQAQTEAGAQVTRGGTSDERLRRVEDDYDKLNNQLRQMTSTLRAEIDDAIVTELQRFEALSNAIRLKDIYWALVGIVVSAAGLVCQLVGYVCSQA